MRYPLHFTPPNHMMTSPSPERGSPSHSNGSVLSQSDSMTTTPALSLDGLKLLSLREVAQTLRVAPITIERLVAKRVLPVYRVARKLLFRPKDISQWLERQRTDSHEHS